MLEGHYKKGKGISWIADSLDGNNILGGVSPVIEEEIYLRKLVIIRALGHYFYGSVAVHDRHTRYHYLSLLVGHDFFFKDEDEFNTVVELFQQCLDFPIAMTTVIRFEAKDPMDSCSNEALHRVAILNSNVSPIVLYKIDQLDLEAQSLKHDPLSRLTTEINNALDAMSDFSQSSKDSLSHGDVDVAAKETGDFGDEVPTLDFIGSSDCPASASHIEDPILDEDLYQSDFQNSTNFEDIAPPLSQVEQEAQREANYDLLLDAMGKEVIYDKFFTFPLVKLKPKDQLQLGLDIDDMDALLEAYKLFFEMRLGSNISCISAKTANISGYHS